MLRRIFSLILGLTLLIPSELCFNTYAYDMVSTSDVTRGMGLTYTIIEKNSNGWDISDAEFEAFHNWGYDENGAVTLGDNSPYSTSKTTGLPTCIIDLGTPCLIKDFVSYGKYDVRGKCSFEYSVDNLEWNSVDDSNSTTTGYTSAENTTFYKSGVDLRYTSLTDEVVARYIKVTIGETGSNIQFSELCVFGERINTFLNNVSFEPNIGELTPAFAKEINSYVLYLDSMEYLPELNVEVADSNCSKILEQANAENDYTAKVIVAVDGYSQFFSTYTFKYVLAEPDSTLSSLTASGGGVKTGI